MTSGIQSRLSSVKFATVILGNIGAPLRDGRSSIDEDDEGEVEETSEIYDTLSANAVSSETVELGR